MRYMLDTCAVIDALTDPTMLGEDVRALMEDYDNLFYVSQETVKEVILKYKIKQVWSNNNFINKYGIQAKCKRSFELLCICIG